MIVAHIEINFATVPYVQYTIIIENGKGKRKKIENIPYRTKIINRSSTIFPFQCIYWDGFAIVVAAYVME